MTEDHSILCLSCGRPLEPELLLVHRFMPYVCPSCYTRITIDITEPTTCLACFSPYYFTKSNYSYYFNKTNGYEAIKICSNPSCPKYKIIDCGGYYSIFWESEQLGVLINNTLQLYLDKKSSVLERLFYQILQHQKFSYLTIKTKMREDSLILNSYFIS